MRFSFFGFIPMDPGLLEIGLGFEIISTEEIILGPARRSSLLLECAASGSRLLMASVKAKSVSAAAGLREAFERATSDSVIKRRSVSMHRHSY